MALSVTGHDDEARAAYRWLSRSQLGDGSWFNYYLGERVKDARLDTNVCAYVAAGIYHHLLATGDVDFAAEMWPCVERAVEWVLRLQLDDGTVRWSLDAQGRPESYALLTGSASVFHSLRCAVALAERLDLSRPAWELAAGRLGHAVAHHPGAFAPKNEFAMDWYYPIFSGALTGEAGRAPPRRRLGASRHGRLRRALRVDQRLGHRRRDRRVRPHPRRAGHDGARARAASRSPGATVARTARTGRASPTRAARPSRRTRRPPTRRPRCSWPPTRSARRAPRRGSSATARSARRSTCPSRAARSRRHARRRARSDPHAATSLKPSSRAARKIS